MNILPEQFLTRLKTIHPENFLEILQGFQNERIGSFRINVLNASKEEVFSEFSEKNIAIQEISKEFGIFMFEKKFEYQIKGTESFYTGKIYLQSLASMLPVILLAPKQNTCILDVCAAPGSKTTQIASFTENKSKIIALEKNQIRYKKLQYNCDVQSAHSVTPHKIDALKFLQNSEEKTFDAILLDAPCSAEGRISTKNEKSYGFWSEKNIQEKAELQYQLLSSSLKKLSTGGSLVYSTCTLAPEENEGVVSRILFDHPEFFLEEIDVPEDFLTLSSSKNFLPGITDFLGEKFSKEISKTLRILPSKYFEGFFIAKLRKKK